ncbi:MAG TPA: cardiolipin synthase ClsB [Thiobacillaceae bacterium]|nr:cardiolipin synthase ClsB [Thiobacillaceae bacterium]
MFRPGNRLTLLENGASYFPALLEALDGARQEIHLESYIFEPDDTGRAVLDALIRAARRDVRVHMLLDGFGCRDFPPEIAEKLAAAGVQLMFFRPEPSFLLRFRRHRLRRMHRKIVLIDARIAFVGGINVIDDRTGQPLRGRQPAHRYDYAVRMEGPVLVDVWQAVRRLWWLVRWSRIGHRPGLGRDPQPDAHAIGTQPAAFLVRDNLRNRRAIESAYLDAIRAAREEILIANAYFLPGRRFRQALIQAARRGVRVVLLMQGATDHRLYLLAAQALYGHFLENGVEIHEYRASYLHAKVATVDEDWSTVGSSNIDPFSLVMAREGNVFVRDCRFTDELRRSLHQAIRERARPLHARLWRRQPWYRRAASWAVYGLVRLAAGLVGYAGLN